MSCAGHLQLSIIIIVGPADPVTQIEENREEVDQENEDGDISIMDVTLEPGNEDQITSSHCLDGPVWLKIDDLQL